MPSSTIDIVSPVAGSTQPLQFTVNVDYQNNEVGDAYVMIQCSYGDLGPHFAAATSVSPGHGPADGSFIHSKGSSGVTITARLVPDQNDFDSWYASTSVGDITIAGAPPIGIDPPPGGWPSGVLFEAETFKRGTVRKEKSPLRLPVATGKDLTLTGTYDSTVGPRVAVVFTGISGKNQRPHMVLSKELPAADVAGGKWTVTVGSKITQGTHLRGVAALLLDADGIFQASASVGLKKA